MSTRYIKISAAVLVLSLMASPIWAEARVEGFRSKMEKWVETRRIISEERSGWEAEQEMLRATRGLLHEQKAALEEEIAALEASTTAADGERQKLLLERGEYQRAARTLQNDLVEMESRVRVLAPRLPEPLQEKLEPLLVQMPTQSDAANQRLGMRLMNVLGVLAQAEKFNGTATFVGETREVPGGEKVLVRTLYWGLGQAIYVDARRRTAGIGRPGSEGWEFSAESELAEDAALLLDIYEGNVDAIEFVQLPVVVRP